MMSSSASSNFNSHHNHMLSAANNNNNASLNGNLGLDRKFSTTSQPPMHLNNYPPKPHQSLQLLQPSTPHLMNGSIRRTSMQQPATDLPMPMGPSSTINRGTSVGYPNNSTGSSNNFMNNRGSFQPPTSIFQQGILGPNNNVTQSQHSVHPQQMRNGHGQFHGQQSETPLIQHVSINRICN